MAFVYRGSTAVCDGVSPNVFPGPVQFKGIVIPTGSVTISTAAGTIEVLQAGVYDNLEIRSTKTLTIVGACTVHMKLGRNG